MLSSFYPHERWWIYIYILDKMGERKKNNNINKIVLAELWDNSFEILLNFTTIVGIFTAFFCKSEVYLFYFNIIINLNPFHHLLILHFAMDAALYNHYIKTKWQYWSLFFYIPISILYDLLHYRPERLQWMIDASHPVTVCRCV